ncbi:MbnP family protein [Hyunsoonleella aestuarii]|uniref:Copper-binding protein MbnP-like domain-containing protein n=1 Tax=Hyunsoonleella aestuarii TaxID=912802 RepID=A0ABP8E8H1_9FLAO|nr:MbnP family protein [Hyunsoonleella aestuarii]
MNKLTSIFLLILAVFVSCDTDNDDTISNAKMAFNFSHTWDGTPVTNSDFNDLKFTNANGETLSIERLRYLISDITFTSLNGETLKVNGYNLVDVTNNEDLTFEPITFIPAGTYTNVSFIFGFKNEDNIHNAYQDLNSISWSVPTMLGGGYHYMQLDGKFVNSSNTEQGYNFHAIRAVDNPGNRPTFPQNTFITVNLGSVNISGNSTFNIEMNIAEWFKNPNRWDLNQLNQGLMPNSMAQIMMFENGQNVFNLISIE